MTVESPDAATAIVTLNRPERRNALNIALLDSLCRTLESIADEPDRRTIILRGAGRAFCAGLDLDEAADMQLAERSAEAVARAFETVAASPLVTVAAVHGAAYAGGAGLLASCDLAVASDDLRVAFPEVRRGLVPALVAAVLRDRLRDGDLRELLLLGEPIDARRALEIGLVQRVVPGDRLMEEAGRIAATVAKAAPGAIRQTKRLLRAIHGNPLQAFALALDAHREARRSNEAAEGLAAFRQRREPNWT